MASAFELLPVDLIACISSFSTPHDFLKLRAVSRTLQRKVDSNALWSHRLVAYSDVTAVVPRAVLPSGPQWRDFALKHGLLRLPPTLGPQFGKWAVLARGSMQQSRNHVHDDTCQLVVEALRPPLPLHRALPTVSVGLLLCASRLRRSGTNTAEATFHETVWPLIESQVQQFLEIAAASEQQMEHQQPNTVPIPQQAADNDEDDEVQEARRLEQAERQKQLAVQPLTAPHATLFVMNAFPLLHNNGNTAPSQGVKTQQQQQSAFRMVLCAVDAPTPTPHSASNPTDGQRDANRAIAEQFTTLMHTCTLVHVIAEDDEDLVAFAERIAPILPTVDAAAFSTNFNTPTLIFNTTGRTSGNTMKQVSLKAADEASDLASVLQRCPHSFQTWVLNRTCSVGTATLAHRNLFSLQRSPFAVPAFAAPSVTAAIGPSSILRMAGRYLADRNADFPRSRAVWEENTIKHLVQGHVSFHATFYSEAMTTDFDEGTRSSQAPYVALTDGQIEALVVFEKYRVLSAHVLNETAETQPEERFDEDGAMELVAAPNAGNNTATTPHQDRQRQLTTAMYENLNNTDLIIRQYRSLLAGFPQERVPMDPHEMVETHNGHCYTALRRFAFALPTVCGPDTEKGLRQLEILKREVANEFRTLWRRNNEYSRVYCNTLFSFIVVAPIFSKFFTDRFGASVTATTAALAGDQARFGIQEKRGLRNFFRIAKDVIEEYILKSRGLRQFDILSERLADSLIPSILTFCKVHPHQNTPLEAVQEACDELVRDVVKANAAYSKSVDGRLNEAQQASALYTASLSSEWAAESERCAIAYMKRIEDEVEAWESACLARIRILLQENGNGRSDATTRSEEGDTMTRSTRSSSTTDGQQQHLQQEMVGEMNFGVHPAAVSFVGNVHGDGDAMENAASNPAPTREELEEAEDAARRMEYEEARRQLLQQAVVSEANFRTQSARLSSRLASTSSSQHSKSFSIVRSQSGEERGQAGALASRLKDSLRRLFN